MSTPKLRLIATAVLGAVLCAASASADDTSSASKWRAPRTADGHPDLQGNWTNATITPFERPEKYAERLVLSEQEADELEQAEAKFNATADAPTDPKTRVEDLPASCGRGFSGANCGYNNFWVDPGTKLININGQRRSSMLVDPPNGRLPAMTEAGKERMARRMAAFRRGDGGGAADGPEMRSLGERCILSFGSSAGPPMIPLLYNNNYQIVQSKDSVLILVEMVHDARVVRLNSKHRPSSVRTWMGDSIGWWEGETLVVETTNFRPDQSFRASSQNLKVTERFTRIDPNQILYRFTVEDPETFTQPFSGEVAMNATSEKIYEYACHEGNYALPGILAGARAQEQEAAVKAAEKK
ncbi:MAG TPA: hypothetical protein VFO35_15905 [Steroidobacteraceae bacterium]|nr:hypothetical protein [Steroidobacteraceae bacterium]